MRGVGSPKGWPQSGLVAAGLTLGEHLILLSSQFLVLRSLLQQRNIAFPHPSKVRLSMGSREDRPAATLVLEQLHRAQKTHVTLGRMPLITQLSPGRGAAPTCRAGKALDAGVILPGCESAHLSHVLLEPSLCSWRSYLASCSHCPANPRKLRDFSVRGVCPQSDLLEMSGDIFSFITWGGDHGHPLGRSQEWC